MNVFSANPGGRARKDGEFSGEKFREEILIPLLEKHKYIELDISDAYGLGSSFLEEAFGGLVRVNGMNKREVLHRIKIVSDIKLFEEKIEEYINKAKR